MIELAATVQAAADAKLVKDEADKKIENAMTSALGSITAEPKRSRK